MMGTSKNLSSPFSWRSCLLTTFSSFSVAHIYTRHVGEKTQNLTSLAGKSATYRMRNDHKEKKKCLSSEP